MNDLTQGKPSQVMLRFALPIALGNIFQLFYSLADTRVVGSTLGMTSLAAVGATASISTLFIGFLSGLANGFSILVAREYGAGSRKGVRRLSAGSLTLGFVTALVFTVVCVTCLPLLLHILNVQDELMAEAIAYIRVILLGLVAILAYNACAGILRAVGDTTAALCAYGGAEGDGILYAAVWRDGLDYGHLLWAEHGSRQAGADSLRYLAGIASELGMVGRYGSFKLYDRSGTGPYGHRYGSRTGTAYRCIISEV